MDFSFSMQFPFKAPMALILSSRDDSECIIAVNMQRMLSELGSVLLKIQEAKFLGAVLGATIQSFCHEGNYNR